MKEKIKEYSIITFGIILVCIAIQYFYIPNNINGGGVTGIALVINNYLPQLNLGILMAIMNLFLFIIAFIFIGTSFGGKTIYAAMGLSALNWFVEEFIKPVGFSGDTMLGAIAGTVLLGIGLGIVFTQDASTGGTDIIAKILNKFFHIDMGKGMQIVDIMVVLLSAVTFGADKGVYAAICVLLNGVIIDKVVQGFNTCYQVMVFTEKIEELRTYINRDLDRGCTVFQGEGGYTREKRNIVYCVLGRTQLVTLRKYIKENDKEAFIIVNEAHNVLGKGFGEIE